MSATEERPVLVATEDDDVTVDMVITELNRRGVPVVRFNPADIGDGLTVSARYGVRPAHAAGRMLTRSRVARLDDVRSVYWRRPTWPAFPRLSPDDARFAAAQGTGQVCVPLERVVLDRPDPVERHAFGEDRLFDAVADHLVLPLHGRVGRLGFEDHGEFHDASRAASDAVRVRKCFE